MKDMFKSLHWMFAALLTLAFALPAQAQDDLYYDPATDAKKPVATTHYEDEDEPTKVTRRYDNDDYYEEDEIGRASCRERV